MPAQPVRFALLGLSLLAVAGGPPPPSSAQGSRERASVERLAGYVPGEILVKFTPAAREAATRRYRDQQGFRTLRRFPSIGAQLERLPAGMAVETALAALRADPEVFYAEPNHYRYADQVVPDDPGMGLLWGLHNTGQEVNGTAGTAGADIDAPEAWEVTVGSGEVVIAVVDSGLDFTHPDLAANLWINADEVAGNAIDDDGNGYVDDVHGWDFVAGDAAPYPNDANGHGTHVAGTIAAAGNNGVGVAGVSWAARLMPLRFLDAYGVGDTANAILAIEYAGANGARIVNNSWGGGGFSQALQDAIEASPALVVCAAGNEGVDTDALPHYPASYPSANVLSVAATDSDDRLPAFSNYGATSVDLGAPGVDTYSAVPGRQTLWGDDFDDGNTAGWTSGGPNNDWGVTNTESVSVPYSLADSPAGDYSQRTNSWIRAPALNLSGTRNARFEFRIKGRSEAGYDVLRLEVSTDASLWSSRPVRLAGIGTVSGVSGTLAEWTEALVDLSAYDGVGTLYVRFAFVTDWTNNYDGWYIDDVAVTTSADAYDGTEYAFRSGTSMAAPHVSGVAALVWSRMPEATALEVRRAIELSVDPLPALLGQTTTGGRVNARRALVLPLPEAVSLAASPGSPQTVGTVVAFTAAAEPTDGLYEYRYWLKDPVTGWAAVRAYAPDPAWVWDTGARAPGVYTVAVHARALGSTALWEASAKTAFGLTLLPVPASAVLLAADSASPQPLGATVTFTAAAQPAGGLYEYRYWLKDPVTGWAAVRAYAPDPAWVWDTGARAPGVYTVAVHARALGSTALWEASAKLDYSLVLP